jgi:hypothetical protein
MACPVRPYLHHQADRLLALTPRRAAGGYRSLGTFPHDRAPARLFLPDDAPGSLLASDPRRNPMVIGGGVIVAVAVVIVVIMFSKRDK